MDLSEKLELVTELMKSTKDRWVAESPDETDLAIYLHVFRGDDLVVTVQCPLDRDTALRAAHLGASGFRASTISLTFESYTTNTPESPITGKPWMPREMQFVAQTVPDAFEKGWVSEVLTTSIHERDGSYALASQSYIIKDGKVEWGELKTIDPSREQKGEAEGGFMFDVLQSAMRAKTMEEVLAEDAKENPLAALANGLVTEPERRQFHIDMATARALEENKLAINVMMMAEEGSERQQWLAERLGKE